MAVQTITYTDKVALNENQSVADINKVTDDDMNEIKSVVNNNANEEWIGMEIADSSLSNYTYYE